MIKNFFSFKNLQGDYAALATDIRLGMPTAAFGLFDAHKYLIASLPEQKVLYIASDCIAAQNAYSSISVLSGKKCALLTAKDEVILYKDALSKDALYRRISAIHAMLSGAEIVVCDIEAIMQLFPSQIDEIRFKTGEEYDYLQLPNKLVKMGYTREYAADTRGCFAVRGDILEVFPINSETPVRIDFFGDTVEKIRPFDSVSDERLEEIHEVLIVSATDVRILPGEREKILSELTAQVKKSPDVKAYERAKKIAEDIAEKLEQNTSFSGASFLMPLLGCTRNIFDLTDENTLIVFDECKSVNDRMDGIYKEHTERVSDLKRGGEAFAFSQNQLISPETLKEGFKKYA